MTLPLRPPRLVAGCNLPRAKRRGRVRDPGPPPAGGRGPPGRRPPGGRGRGTVAPANPAGGTKGGGDARAPSTSPRLRVNNPFFSAPLRLCANHSFFASSRHRVNQPWGATA